MVQIPAQSVAQVLVTKLNRRISISLKNKGFIMQMTGGKVGTHISNAAAALSQLLSEMLNDSDDVTQHDGDNVNVTIFTAVNDTPEYAKAHKNINTRPMYGEDIFIVHQGRKLYRFEQD
jgi:uncharacterized protein YgfB (UPF0149 family)